MRHSLGAPSASAAYRLDRLRPAFRPRRLECDAVACQASRRRHCGTRIADCGIESAIESAIQCEREQFSTSRPVRLSRPRRSAPRAGLGERAARIRHGRRHGSGERRSRRRVPRRARRQPQPATQSAIESAFRIPRSAIREGPDGEPCGARMAAADGHRGRAPARQGERQGPGGRRRSLRRADPGGASRPGRPGHRGAVAGRRLARARTRRGRCAAVAAPAVRGDRRGPG